MEQNPKNILNAKWKATLFAAKDNIDHRIDG
jgi:hypothetical protein